MPISDGGTQHPVRVNIGRIVSCELVDVGQAFGRLRFEGASGPGRQPLRAPVQPRRRRVRRLHARQPVSRSPTRSRQRSPLDGEPVERLRPPSRAEGHRRDVTMQPVRVRSRKPNLHRRRLAEQLDPRSRRGTLDPRRSWVRRTWATVHLAGRSIPARKRWRSEGGDANVDPSVGAAQLLPPVLRGPFMDP